jgi:hypothetical protein
VDRGGKIAAVGASGVLRAPGGVRISAAHCDRIYIDIE